MTKLKVIFSIVIKALIVILVSVAYTISYLDNGRGLNTLLYFTNLSNIWLAILDFILIIYLALALKKGEYKIKNGLYRIQQVFTVCIAVTGLVFMCILLPGIIAYKGDSAYNPFTSYSMIFHLIVPILGILDYFLFIRDVKFKRFDYLYVVIPTLGYFIFATIGYYLGWDFGEGRNFPYFFLNFDSPAGIFGFSSEMPYFMGSFYWVLVLTGIIVGLSYFFKKMLELIIKRRVKSIE